MQTQGSKTGTLSFPRALPYGGTLQSGMKVTLLEDDPHDPNRVMVSLGNVSPKPVSIDKSCVILNS